MKQNHSVRVRFAPSPTGRLHIGSARTALYNFLLARQTGGEFILRFEDTDRKRYKPETEQEIFTGLRWLGLEWDEGPDIGGPHEPYRQSERKEIYLSYAEKLIETGHAYRCFCTPSRLGELRKEQTANKIPPRYDRLCSSLSEHDIQRKLSDGEPFVIRFKMPDEGATVGHDHLRGDIRVENKNLDDSIIVKSNGFALYHLAAMVDDHLMGITHVFRTSEWLPTFPLHVRIYEAFGWKQPVWIHPSVFLKPSGKGKMSKRESVEMAKGGQSIFLSDMQDLGYLPEAVNNWIALMGWSYDSETEFFTMPDLIEKFDIDRLNPSPAAINFTKLDHFNGLHIRNLSTEDLAGRLGPYFEKAGYAADEKRLVKLAPILQTRLKTLDDAPEMAGFIFKDSISTTLDALIPAKTTQTEALSAARASLDVLDKLQTLDHETAEAPLRELATRMELKAGQLFGVLRGAVTGQRVSPPLFETMEIVGKEVVLSRLKDAIKLLETS